MLTLTEVPIGMFMVQKWVVSGEFGLTQFNQASNQLIEGFLNNRVHGCLVVFNENADVRKPLLAYARKIMSNPVVVPTVMVNQHNYIGVLYEITRTVMPQLVKEIKLCSELAEAENLLLEMLTQKSAKK